MRSRPMQPHTWPATDPPTLLNNTQAVRGAEVVHAKAHAPCERTHTHGSRRPQEARASSLSRDRDEHTGTHLREDAHTRFTASSGSAWLLHSGTTQEANSRTCEKSAVQCMRVPLLSLLTQPSSHSSHHAPLFTALSFPQPSRPSGAPRQDS